MSRELSQLGSEVWTVISDPTRRRIIDLLRVKARTTTQLCAYFGISRFAVMKHLSVLEKAGLLTVTRSGRERWNHLDTAPIRRVVLPWLEACLAKPRQRWRLPQRSGFSVEED